MKTPPKVKKTQKMKMTPKVKKKPQNEDDLIWVRVFLSGKKKKAQ